MQNFTRDLPTEYLQKGNFGEDPELLVNGPKVVEKYREFLKALPETRIYYAVKALTHDDILKALDKEGSSFDCASVSEIKKVLEIGGTPDRICYGNTIKSDREIKDAYELGVRLMVTDSVADVEALAKHAPGCEVYCRFITRDGVFGKPYSIKFGCDEGTTIEVLKAAHEKGLIARGVSFHVGTQKLEVEVWDAALEMAVGIFVQMKNETGVTMDLVNMGGAFPATYATTQPIPSIAEYGTVITNALAKHFAGWTITTMIEPGRSLVGDPGMLVGHVKNVSRCSKDEPLRAFLDIGTYHGLRETKPDGFVPFITTLANVGVKKDYHLFGPSCDSTDWICEGKTFELPANLKRGDIIVVHNWGAYSGYNTNFNRFPAPKVVVLWEQF